MNKNAILSILFIISLVGIFPSCNIYDLPPQEELFIVETLEREGYTTFVRAIDRVGLREDLTELGPYTIFAPDDDAFATSLRSLGYGSLEAIPLENLFALLSYHISPGRNLSTIVNDGELQTFLEDAPIIIRKIDKDLVINDSIPVTRRDIEARNGVIHGISKSLLPPSNNIIDVAERNNFSIFLSVVEAAELRERLQLNGPFTVFIPNNTAFTRYLNDMEIDLEEFLDSEELEIFIDNHIIDGIIPSNTIESGEIINLNEKPIYTSIAPNGAIWINGTVRVIGSNQRADNGIVHTIDYIITPPTANMLEKLTLDNQNSSVSYSILLEAIEIAGLSNLLSRGFEENLTLFAPSDEAFEAYFDELEVSGIRQISSEDLLSLLQYHLVPSRNFSQDFREDVSLPTLIPGQTLTISLTSQRINDVAFSSSYTNILTTNGLIHGIEAVLIPD
ncbi:fasciclin domain-containing protein [Belliella kenyensis]|uniref:Fasciclin domain-containing protein n=1 Tax=Belliella kenyensis TaxID=1472724 RepID=A0ABV8EPM6_9BACT|nr:fasciclin domain-containing protein [Belliella kenyensis]MCH7401616.1 fasciclin domain-containing protein [Belliella kenyensis]MDN3603105.1 fasciclin domain-containing protein [Belliella kenyensis]